MGAHNRPRGEYLRPPPRAKLWHRRDRQRRQGRSEAEGGGKWNVMEITAKGSTFTVILNGQKTVDAAQDAKFASGRIALQHGLGVKDDKGVVNDKGVVRFRKVEIKSL